MPPNNICGVYKIECVVTEELYVGSSLNMKARWSGHRSDLKRGRHLSRNLQSAWRRYGAKAFRFVVLCECAAEIRFVREQEFIDALKPVFNNSPKAFGIAAPSEESIARRIASLRARAALVTHCPRGHLYDAANTYLNKKGKRICRACNALRVKQVYEKETAEQRERRRDRAGASYRSNRDARNAHQREYMAMRKAEKREYDRRRREALAHRVTTTNDLALI